MYLCWIPTERSGHGERQDRRVKLEQQGWIRAKWGVSDNNRKAKFYAISPAGRRRLAAEAERWGRVASIVERFLKPEGSAS